MTGVGSRLLHLPEVPMSPALRLRVFIHAACLISAFGSPARASNPTSGYVVPMKVDFLPDQAGATQVIIHGAFFFWLNGFNYTTPKCGYMYFACKQGDDVMMCRMQWNQIAAAIGNKQSCQGFGQNSV